MFNNIIIAGLGLMGGSLALAIKKNNLAKQIIAYDCDEQALEEAVKRKIINKAVPTMYEAAALAQDENDLIIIAVPLKATEQVLIDCAAASPKSLITEIGSAKGHLRRMIQAHLKGKSSLSNFVPSHPIAGIEKNGLSNASAELYKNHKCIITPLDNNLPESVARIAAFWQAIGSDVSYMDIKLHDKIFSYTSHLPHLLSYTLVESLSQDPNAEDFFNYAAGGFRDFTRIAASDERMWADVFAVNRGNLLKAITRFQKFLAQMRSDLQESNEEQLIARIKRARHGRQRFEESKSKESSTAPPTASSTKHKKSADVFSSEFSSEFDYVSYPCSQLTGEIKTAADKSISHRSIIIGSIAEGISSVNNFLPAEDTLNTINIFRAMGVSITMDRSKKSIKIKGAGLQGLRKPDNFLDCGNSGTAARLLCGLLSGQSFSSQIRGDISLSSRPMDRVITPLSQMGARIYASNNHRLPLLIIGNRTLRPIDYDMPVASAQIKSAIILASLYTDGETLIKEIAPTRDHTERMLKNFGYRVARTKDGTISVKGKGRLNAASINVPADISSAAFFIVATLITPNSSLLLKDVSVNPTRIGIITILNQMGANIELQNKRQFGNEPVADIAVTSSELSGITIAPELVPLAIDEMPIIMVAAAYAKGTTRISGAEELRVKETDRIAAMVDGLTRIGVKVKATKDGAVIEGGKGVKGGIVDSYQDHRIAMSFTVAACAAEKPIHVQRCANVATSFPDFRECASSLGMEIITKSG